MLAESREAHERPQLTIFSWSPAGGSLAWMHGSTGSRAGDCQRRRCCLRMGPERPQTDVAAAPDAADLSEMEPSAWRRGWCQRCCCPSLSHVC